MKYSVNGVPQYESTGGRRSRTPSDVLKQREGHAGRRQAHRASSGPDPVRRSPADLLAHYEATGSRDLSETGYRLAHLDRTFRGRRIATLGPTDATRYIVARRDEGAKDGTIRRELSTLTTMLNLAAEQGKLWRVPKLRKSPEGKPRQGFLEPDQFTAVVRHLSPDLQVAATVGYVLGWRCQSEVMTLDVATWTSRPRCSDSIPRLRGRGAGRVPSRRAPGAPGRAGGESGRPPEDTWPDHPVVVPALDPGRLPPARRSSVRLQASLEDGVYEGWRGRVGSVMTCAARPWRNLVTRDGIPERVAMEITGHKPVACSTPTTS